MAESVTFEILSGGMIEYYDEKRNKFRSGSKLKASMTDFTVKAIDYYVAFQVIRHWMLLYCM